VGLPGQIWALDFDHSVPLGDACKCLKAHLENPVYFSIKIFHVCARLFTGFLPDNWWRKTAANRQQASTGRARVSSVMSPSG